MGANIDALFRSPTPLGTVITGTGGEDVESVDGVEEAETVDEEGEEEAEEDGGEEDEEEEEAEEAEGTITSSSDDGDGADARGKASEVAGTGVGSSKAGAGVHALLDDAVGDRVGGKGEEGEGGAIVLDPGQELRIALGPRGIVLLPLSTWVRVGAQADTRSEQTV